MKQEQGLSPLAQDNTSNLQVFIPDLCQVNAVIVLVILTQLLSVVLALVHDTQLLFDWEYLGLSSVFNHSIVLSCAGIICTARSFLAKQSPRTASFFALLVITGVTTIYSYSGALLLSDTEQYEIRHFIIRNLIISGIIGCLLLRYFYFQYQWRQQKQAELHARLEALQARIRPHFLFNSMNTIASLIAIDPHKAEEAVLDLSTLFRATLNNQSMLISLKEELDLAKRYLNIESLRLGDRLKIDWQIDPATLQAKIPPLTLQPLVENAIYHGIQPRTEGGTVKLVSYQKSSSVYILITNPYEASQPEHSGNQIALENIRSRLEALFNQRAILKTSQLDNTFTVTLRFPILD